jgi:hypothetical protein
MYLDATREPYSFLYIQKKNKINPFRITFNIVLEEEQIKEIKEEVKEEIKENKLKDNNINDVVTIKLSN